MEVVVEILDRYLCLGWPDADCFGMLPNFILDERIDMTIIVTENSQNLHILIALKLCYH